MPTATNDPPTRSATSVPLFALIYQELRRIARGQRRSAGSPPTLETTALVHEVYLKLHNAPEAASVDRTHFFSIAARAMRQVLVDHARARSRLKRGGDIQITGLDEQIGIDANVVDLVALDAALTELSRVDPRAGELVEWHVFGGIGIAEIAHRMEAHEEGPLAQVVGLMSSKRAIRRRSCSGKVRHTSQANAEVARRVMIRAGRAAPGTMSAYRCQFCGGYHVGTRPGTGGLRPA